MENRKVRVWVLEAKLFDRIGKLQACYKLEHWFSARSICQINTCSWLTSDFYSKCTEFIQTEIESPLLWPLQIFYLLIKPLSGSFSAFFLLPFLFLCKYFWHLWIRCTVYLLDIIIIVPMKGICRINLFRKTSFCSFFDFSPYK